MLPTTYGKGSGIKEEIKGDGGIKLTIWSKHNLETVPRV